MAITISVTAMKSGTYLGQVVTRGDKILVPVTMQAEAARLAKLGTVVVSETDTYWRQYPTVHKTITYDTGGGTREHSFDYAPLARRVDDLVYYGALFRSNTAHTSLMGTPDPNDFTVDNYPDGWLESLEGSAKTVQIGWLPNYQLFKLEVVQDMYGNCGLKFSTNSSHPTRVPPYVQGRIYFSLSPQGSFAKTDFPSESQLPQTVVYPGSTYAL